ncbi:family 27 putative glycoside hydrolase [Podospora australis]|uniref:Alpha-galactosidase n=1 Tax=Podospora australis TaxID=1536484 RepID=A0AAN6WMN7_9PEZI|nr:family 27 putative glycoside hydrolase [Podospora australis]
MLSVLLAGLALSDRALAIVSQDGTGRLPAMGWNSWNEYACDITEEDFVKTGELLISLGLKDVGYEYINIDDCWSDKEKKRDPTTKEIIIDTAKFPNGISHLADTIHGLGLKLGIYSDAGAETCAGYAGSLGYEAIDAATFSKWGIDYLKYDNCAVPEEVKDEYEFIPEELSDNAPPDYDWSTSNTAKRYRAMRDALLKQNRTIQYSLCAWGHAHVEEWGNTTGHSWRMWGDIMPMWAGKEKWSWGLMPIVNQAAFLWNYTDFWGHNDWDMLEVGNGNLTFEESRSHFTLWAALKSPLIIGTKLDTIEKPILDILSNKEIIAFNQDPVYGASARPFKWDGVYDMEHPAAYWVGTSVKGIHLFLLNSHDKAQRMRTRFSEIPALSEKKGDRYLVRDMWAGKDLGVYKGDISVVVATHGTAALRITKLDGSHPNPVQGGIVRCTSVQRQFGMESAKMCHVQFSQK